MRRNRHQKCKLEKRGGSSGLESSASGKNSSDSNSESDQPSILDNIPPPVPNFVATSSAPTEQDLEEWMRARDEPIPTGTPPNIVSRFNDNRAMSKNVLLAAKRTPESFRGVRDSSGRLQAGATISNEINCIYIETFSTSPWNILRGSSNSVREAGTTLMAEIIKESIVRGHRGEVRLSSLSGAISFYESIGFVTDEESGEMILSSQDADGFLKSRGQQGQ